MSKQSNYPKGANGPGAPPKYINDFSKALANEVRILLQEVGQLRDERRQLQYEIAELMAVKSKFGAGGEYVPDWKPKAPEPEPAPAPPPEEEAPPAPARPAWRTVNVRQERRERAKAKYQPTPAPAPPQAIAAPQPQMPSWAQWKPANPILSPIPQAIAPPPPKAPTPRQDGLFGPRTPPPK